MGNVISLEGWRNRDLLASWRPMIDSLVKDVNISIEPEISMQGKLIVISWTGPEGQVILGLNPETQFFTVNLTLRAHPCSLEGASHISLNNRFIGYWFDDNCHLD